MAKVINIDDVRLDDSKKERVEKELKEVQLMIIKHKKEADELWAKIESLELFAGFLRKSLRQGDRL